MTMSLRILYGVAASLVATGLMLLIGPFRAPRAPAAPRVDAPVTASPPVLPTPDVPTAYTAIVRANIFSVDRQPPGVRFTPAGTSSRDPRVARAPTPTIRLYGITVEGSGAASALIDANPAIPGAEIYHVGDIVAGAPILEITDSTVVLGQPSGARVLRLQTASRRQP